MISNAVYTTDFGEVLIPEKLMRMQKINKDGTINRRRKAYKSLKRWTDLANLIIEYHWKILDESVEDIDTKLFEDII